MFAQNDIVVGEVYGYTAKGVIQEIDTSRQYPISVLFEGQKVLQWYTIEGKFSKLDSTPSIRHFA